MNKKYLIAIGGLAIIFVVFLMVGIFSQQNPQQAQTKQQSPQTSSGENQNPAVFHGATTNTTNNTITPSVTLVPPATTAQGAVKQFYAYYFSSPSNPLANGAYKGNPYLAADFKDVIGSLYHNGNSPVFCTENKRENITVGQETPVNYTDAVLMQEVISEAPPGNKELYRVLVQNVNDTWLIYDINCI